MTTETAENSEKDQEKIIPRLIEEEMKSSYLDYAMSVIVGRALPDFRDGLKPVHRRILFGMHDLGVRHKSPYKKCARIVGDVLGKYHPHGDQSVYDALVRMAQSFSLRYPLVDGQGNFGCFTKDTKVQLTDGRQLSFENLIKEFKEGKKNYTYTVDGDKIKIAEIIKPRLTIKNAKIMKVILDNSEEIKCTLNHKFMLRNGEYKEAQDLKSGESLMPLYTRRSNKEDSKPEIVDYDMILQPNKKWVFAHHLADNYNIFNENYKKSTGRVKHHIDFNKHNNNPTNIIRMSWKEHWKLHSGLTKEKHANDSEYVAKLAKGREIYCSKPENRIKQSKRMSLRNKENWQKEEYKAHMSKILSRVNKEFIKNNPEKRKEYSLRATKTLKKLWQDPSYRESMKEKIIKGNKNHTTNITGKKKFLKICKEVLEKEGTLNSYLYEEYRTKLYPYGKATTWETGYSNYYENKDVLDVLEDACENHKIAKIEFLNQQEDVFDLTINNTHNFALAAGVFVHNSVDGDSAAAMRYTEARMARIADEMLQDIEKETIEFGENFDGSLKEPLVLPAKIPNLLINGSSGIAVGMATNIPPHNLTEVANATIAIIENPEIEVNELMELIPGPDFPTGGIIAGRSGIIHAYNHGRGHIKIKSVVEQEEHKGRQRFIVKEIPYQVNKSMLIEQIANCVKDKVIEGISDIRDESDREGMRIVIELKKDSNSEVVLNQLLKHTRMQNTFSIIMLGLDENQPKIYGLKKIIQKHIIHRQIVIRKRTEYDLRKAEERAHVLEGLKIALEHIDPVITLIKAAENANDAKTALSEKYGLTEIQATAILDMKLQKLTGLEQEKLMNELEELEQKIIRFKQILANEQEILKIIKEELEELKDKYNDKRRTQIADVEDEDIDLEDLIEPEDDVVTISHEGYIKRMPLTTYKAQNRGGIGIRGATTKEEDFIEHLFVANTHDYLLIFTDKGRVYWKKVYYISEGSRQSKGKPIINLIKVEKGEKIQTVIPIKEFGEEFLLFVTKNGTIKKTGLESYSRPRQGGINAINLVEGDKLVSVLKTTGDNQILIASKNGQAVKFNEEDARSMGRTATGVRGIRLKGADEVVGAIKARDEDEILTITNKGYGKRTKISEYRLINRGGSGVKNIFCTEKNGYVVAVKSISGGEEIMLATKNGTMIRTLVDNISTIGRNTQGVRVMKLRENDKVVACAKIVDENNDEIIVSDEE